MHMKYILACSTCTQRQGAAAPFLYPCNHLQEVYARACVLVGFVG